MARPPNEEPTREVRVRLPVDAFNCLTELAKRKRYGNNPAEVAKYLIIRELDDLTRTKVLD